MKTQIVKDLENKNLTVVREFNAPLNDVWNAWTKSELLDLWWAPKPWKAKTKTMDFRVGGSWLYAMVGPDDSKHWSRNNFLSIDTNKSFATSNFFCDEQGNKNAEMPGVAKWKNGFGAIATGTKVTVELTFDTEAAIKKLVEMGFEAGFTMALGNLDELFTKPGVKK